MDTNVTTASTNAMTAMDLLAECGAIQALCGPQAYVSVVVCTYHDLLPSLSVAFNGICTKADISVRAQSWTELFAEVRAQVAAKMAVRRETLIRRMALAIIGITDEHGECSMQTLKRSDFTESEILELSGAACRHASEMAGNSPFFVGGLTHA